MLVHSSCITPISDFIFVSHPLKKADIIFVPGNTDPQPSLMAASLWADGWAPHIMPSGKYPIGQNAFTSDPRFPSEWAFMQSILLKAGVLDSAIWREDQATYTMENAVLSRQALDQMGRTINTAILACRSFHARRCLMYYQFAFPNTHFVVRTTPYQGITRDTWYKTPEGTKRVLGELARCGSQFSALFEAIQDQPSGI